MLCMFFRQPFLHSHGHLSEPAPCVVFIYQQMNLDCRVICLQYIWHKLTLRDLVNWKTSTPQL